MNKKSILTLCLLLLITLLILFPNLCLAAAQDGVLLWFNKVIPSLLPFIIFINLLVPLNGLHALIEWSNTLTRRIWHLPGYSFFAFLLGLIASYPMGAKTVKELFLDKKLTLEEASITLCFCNNCGPLFIIATVGSAMLNCTSLGYFLLFIHIVSAIILSLFATRHLPYSSTSCLVEPPCNKPLLFSSILNRGVMNAMETILCIGGYIILFSVLIALLTETPFLPFLTHKLLLKNEQFTYFKCVLAGLLELSNGSFIISKISPPSIYSIALISSCLGFGGLCVYCQTLYVLDNVIPSKTYLIAKLAQAFISFGLTLICYPFYLLYLSDKGNLSEQSLSSSPNLLFKWQWLAISIFLLSFSYLLLQHVLYPTRHLILHKNSKQLRPSLKQ